MAYKIKKFKENDEEGSLIVETTTETIERTYTVEDMRRRIRDIDEEVARQLKYREELSAKMNDLLGVISTHKKSGKIKT